MELPGIKIAMLLGAISMSPFLILGTVDAPKRLTIEDKVRVKCVGNRGIESIEARTIDGFVKTYNCSEYRS